jgi:hypothetical protein
MQEGLFAILQYYNIASFVLRSTRYAGKRKEERAEGGSDVQIVDRKCQFVPPKSR